MLTDIVVGLAILVGIAGVVIPVLPGSLLVLAGIFTWALLDGSLAAWSVFAVAAALIIAAAVVKYAWPGSRLVRSGIPRRSVVVGAVAGIVGFFVIPVVGLPVGFVAGTYAAEYRRLRDRRAAWRATVEAIKATGLSMLIELAGALLAAGGWLVAVLVV